MIGKSPEEVLITNARFGYIKTKHGAGSNILGGMIFFGVAGVPVGALLGALTLPLKNPKIYRIRENELEWKRFRHDVENIQDSQGSAN